VVTAPIATNPATPMPSTTVAPAPPPTTLEELIEVLSVDPAAVGPAGPGLLTGLTELADLQGRQARDHAGDLLGAVDSWSADGQLDVAFAAIVRDVLEPLADGPGNGNDGDDNGNGDDD